MAKRKKEPGFYFFPSDWITDQEVHACSWAARGLWFEMLCLMTMLEPRGVLPDGLSTMFKSWNIPKRMEPIHHAELKPLLDELEKEKVFSWGCEVAGALPARAIVNRRMYREWLASGDLSEKRRIAANVRWKSGVMQNDAKRCKSDANGYANGKQNGQGINGSAETRCGENTHANGMQTRCKTDADPNRSLLDRRSNDLRSRKTGVLKPEHVGGLVHDLLTVIAESKPEDYARHYASALVDATGDLAYRKAGYVNRIRVILAWKQGKTRLDELIETITKDGDPKLAEARGHKPIVNVARFATAALSRLESEAKNAMRTGEKQHG